MTWTAEQAHVHYIKYRDQYKGRATAWALANPGKRKETVDRYRWSNKGIDTRLNSTFKRQYGITLLEYNSMLETQQNKCAICKQVETAKYKCIIRHLSVDHNHSTGKVRQILCNNCNRLLGSAKDCIKILEEAIKYLRSSEHCD